MRTIALVEHAIASIKPARFKSKVLLDSMGLPDRPEVLCFVLTTWRTRLLEKAGGSYSPSWAGLEHRDWGVATGEDRRFKRNDRIYLINKGFVAIDSIAFQILTNRGN